MERQPDPERELQVARYLSAAYVAYVAGQGMDYTRMKYADMPVGQIATRLNADIGEIQRVAAEIALAWVGNVIFLIGTLLSLSLSVLGGLLLHQLFYGTISLK